MAAGLNSLIFVVRGDAVAPDRAQRLLEFYAPLGIADVELSRLPRLSLLAGEIRFDGVVRPVPAATWADRDEASLAWGGPLPSSLGRDALLAADEHELRRLDRTLAVFAAAGGRARLATGCAGATALFSARSESAEAWSSHAAAAGYLAHGSVSIDPTMLPEFFAAEFVGTDRTHLRGVSAVAPAAVVDFPAAGERSYWGALERYAPVPEAEAMETAESALLNTLSTRLADSGEIELGLTAGADSRVVAVALRALEMPFHAVTRAPGPQAPDAVGAAWVATHLGVEHRVYGYRFAPDADAESLIDAQVRWSDGLAPPTGLGTPEGGDPDVLLTGGGGETGRAWYYRWQARNYRDPSRRQLQRVLAHLHWRIEGASTEAHQLLDAAIARWIEAAQETGHSGWRTLDVVYDDERLRRWGRARLPCIPAPMVVAFSSPELTRALISLPLADRISDGFHRSFLAQHAPELVPAAPRAQRRGLPRIARQVLTELRLRRGLDVSARDPWFARDVWAERPLNRDFIAEEALGRPVLAEAMGASWVEGLRHGFLAGEDHASQMAFLATGVATFDRALEQLR